MNSKLEQFFANQRQVEEEKRRSLIHEEVDAFLRVNNLTEDDTEVAREYAPESLMNMTRAYGDDIVLHRGYTQCEIVDGKKTYYKIVSQPKLISLTDEEYEEVYKYIQEKSENSHAQAAPPTTESLHKEQRDASAFPSVTDNLEVTADRTASSNVGKLFCGLGIFSWIFGLISSIVIGSSVSAYGGFNFGVFFGCALAVIIGGANIYSLGEILGRLAQLESNTSHYDIRTRK